MIQVQNNRWFQDKGDETVALDWPIGRDALVWEIGGFEGRWAKQMVDKFDCQIEIFEPQAWAVERMRNKFNGNDHVTIYPWGLWVMDARMSMAKYETDGCTILDAEGTGARAEFHDVFKHNLGRTVDVCLMNIEGAEFYLLPYLIGMDLVRNFRYFWCQFHPGLVEYGDERSNIIFRMMAHTHRKKWDYFPTAVCWERKS